MKLSFDNMILELNGLKCVNNLAIKKMMIVKMRKLNQSLRSIFKNSTNYLQLYFAGSFKLSKILKCDSANICSIFDST